MILHICCAPCGGGCVERLKKEDGAPPVLYYSNSNLDSAEEFERRLDSVRQLAREAGVSQNAMTQRLARLRRALRSRLEEEGVIQ